MATKHVYVVEAAIGVIKIGCSHWPHQRADLISAHSPSPVRLIAILNGDGKSERALHARFAPYRSHNEWFRNEGNVTEFVRAIFGHGMALVASWSDCDRSPHHGREADRRKRLSEMAKARWADPAFRARQAEYRHRRAALRAEREAA